MGGAKVQVEDDDDGPPDLPLEELRGSIEAVCEKFGFTHTFVSEGMGMSGSAGVQAVDMDQLMTCFVSTGIRTVSALESVFHHFELSRTAPCINEKTTDHAPGIYKTLMQKLNAAGVPATFLLLLEEEIGRRCIELRTWRLGAQFTTSVKIQLSADGLIKETRGAFGMSSSSTYTKIKTGIADIDKKSKFGSATFTFKRADNNQLVTYKGVKNMVAVMSFIEKYMWNLDFPALVPPRKPKDSHHSYKK